MVTVKKILALGVICGVVVLALGMLAGFQVNNPLPGTLTSVTLTGDGTVLSSTPSSPVTGSGTLTAALAQAAAGTILNNATASAAVPTYTATPSLGAAGGTTGTVTFNGSTSGSPILGCNAAACTQIQSSVALSATKYVTNSNCAGVGTAANPSVVTCTAAGAGAFSCATAASTGTCQVNTTAVTANSEIIVTQVVSEGTRLSVTCNTASVLPAGPLLLSKSAGASFTLTMGTITTNPGCFDYVIYN